MGSDYYRVRARVYFLMPEEGGRSHPIPPLDPRKEPYFVLADLGLGNTEEGRPIRSIVRVEPEGGPGYIELGVEQTVQIMLNGIEGVVIEPGVSFDLAEGAKVVAKATVVSVLE
jgi:translation elongation factor EF-Tu-like GTPase